MENLLRRNTLHPQRATLHSQRSMGYTHHFWPTGSTLTMGFMDTSLSASHEQAIIDAIKQWQPYVNLKFEFIDGRPGQPGYGKADIRITTEYDESYSMFGTDARRNDPGSATMVLGIKPSDPQFRRVVMHEFGHALGAQHEHQHPQADIPWDIPKVYAHYATKGYSQEMVDEAVLNKLPSGSALVLPYDRKSIMHYPVDNALTLGDWEVGFNAVISEKDKAFMARAYPR